jgi:hypothetical protein
MSARTLAGIGALLIALAAPAAAQAVPTIAPLKPCYVTADTDVGPQSEGVQISATGFTPNSKVDLALDGVPYPAGNGLQTGPAGELTLLEPIPAPFVQRGSRTFTITLTEQGNPANTVSATAKSTALGVAVKPKRSAPSDKVRFKGLGFTEERPIFAHYIYKGKVRKTVRMARRPRECGGFRVRRRQIAVRNPGLGVWTIQFDQSRRFVDPAVTPIVFVWLKIRVTLEPR